MNSDLHKESEPKQTEGELLTENILDNKNEKEKVYKPLKSKEE
jgi:hypothetical protein